MPTCPCPDDCTPAEPLVPVCDNPEYCEEITTDKCIIHKGATLANIGAVDTTRLDVILTNIDTALGAEPAVNAAQIIALIESSAELRAAIAAAVA